MGAATNTLGTGSHSHDARIDHGNPRLPGAPRRRPATVRRAADDRGRRDKGASAQRVACQADAESAEDTAESPRAGERRSHQTDAAGRGGGPGAEARRPLDLTERVSTSSSCCRRSASRRDVLGGDVLLTQVQGAESRGRSEQGGGGALGAGRSRPNPPGPASWSAPGRQARCWFRVVRQPRRRKSDPRR